MKLDKKQLEKLNEVNRFIVEKSVYFSDYEDDLIFSDDRIKEILEEEDISEISYRFPGYDEYVDMAVGDILELSDEIISLEILNNGLIKSQNRRYYIVDA